MADRHEQRHRLLAAIVLLPAVSLTIRTIDRNFDYYSVAGMWEDCLRNSPDNKWGLIGVAQGYLDAGRPLQALPLVQRAAKLNPDDPDCRARLGVVLLETGDFPEAVKAFEHAIQLDAHDKLAHHGLGIALAETDRWEQAVQHFKTATKLHDEPDRVLNDFAVQLSKRMENTQAESVLKLALQINPENYEAWNNLGTVIMMQGGEPELAAKCFQTSIFYGPEYEPALQNLGKLSELESHQ